MAAVLAACTPVYPEKTCLPTAIASPQASAGPGKGPVVLYFDASGSMAGYLRGATPDVRPLNDLVATIPGSTADQASTIKVKAFGRQILDVPKTQIDQVAALAFYACNGPIATCNNQQSHIDAVLNEIAAAPADQLSVVVTDLWLSNSEMIGSPAVALGQPIEKIFSQGRSVIVIGIRAPFQGVLSADDFPSRQPYAGAAERPLFLVIIGPLQRALAFRSSLTHFQSASFSEARLRSAVFSASATPLVPSKPMKLDDGATGLRARIVLSPKYRLGASQFLLSKSEARHGAKASASTSLNLPTMAPADFVWRGPLRASASIWRLNAPDRLRACKGAWTKVRDLDGAWRGLQSDVATFTLDAANPSVRGLAPNSLYVVVGAIGRTSLTRPNPATKWMRDWSFNSSTESAVRAARPQMFPTLNLAVVADELEGALDRSTPADGRPLGQAFTVVRVEQ